MQIDIQARGFALTGALRGYAERRLCYALACIGNRIRKVTVRLSDINGPRGGEDKRCQVRMVLAGMPGVVVQNTEADLYAAIDRATERAGYTAARRLARSRAQSGAGRALHDSQAAQ